MSTYPIFLTNLDAQRTVVVGTGPAAERKVEGLLDADARVTLIDPAPAASLPAWADAGRIEWIDRPYRAGDLEGARLVIVTEADADTTTRIREEAQARNVLINVTGDEARSTFANGACVRRGPLVVSVSTSGAAPTLSVRLREHLEDTFGPEYEALLTIMDALRAPMRAEVADFAERRERWYALVDSEVLDLLREGRRTEAWARTEAIVGPAVVDRVDAPLKQTTDDVLEPD